MQLTVTGNNVLATLLSVAQHQRLGKPLKAFNNQTAGVTAWNVGLQF